jgi:hypothetical protein
MIRRLIILAVVLGGVTFFGVRQPRIIDGEIWVYSHLPQSESKLPQQIRLHFPGLDVSDSLWDEAAIDHESWILIRSGSANLSTRVMDWLSRAQNQAGSEIVTAFVSNAVMSGD